MKRLRYLWRALHYRFRQNRKEIEYLQKRIRPGDTVVDVGCHKGGFLFWLRRYVTASGKVYAFEPQQSLAWYLKDIAMIEGWDNVIVEGSGVSSSTGSMELFVPAPQGESSPGATLSPTIQEVTHHRIRVPVVSLDDYFSRLGNPRVACIKCDCEGHEAQVFRGAEGILRRDMPVLLFECEQRHMPDSTPAAVFDYLQSLGYRGFFFCSSGILPIEQFRLEIHQPVREGRYWDASDYFNNFAFTAFPELPPAARLSARSARIAADS